jgi:hypothetical protein
LDAKPASVLDFASWSQFEQETSMPSANEESVLHRFLLPAARALVAIYVVLDDLLVPLFRPIVRWIVDLSLIVRLQQFAAALPPYGILALMAGPFALGEPAKLYAVLLIGTGHWLTGLVVLALAYLVTIILVERVYSAGKAKLRTIGWFAIVMDWLAALRDQVQEWARSTPVFAAVREFMRKVRAHYPQVKQKALEAVEWLRLRLRRG